MKIKIKRDLSVEIKTRLSEKANELITVLFTYVTENRLNNTISK